MPTNPMMHKNASMTVRAPDYPGEGQNAPLWSMMHKAGTEWVPPQESGLTASRVVVTDSDGVMSASSVSTSKLEAIQRTATFTVAASDAHAYSIAAADYPVDGTADDVDLNTARAALPTITSPAAAAGRVLCSEGVLNMTAPVTYSNYIVLEGQGMNSTTLFRASASDVNLVEISGAYSSLKNICLHGNKDNGSPTSGINLVITGATFCVLENVLNTHSPSHGIYALNESDLTPHWWNKVVVIASGQEGAAANGVDITHMAGIYAQGCIFSSAEDENLKLNQVAESTFLGCAFDTPEDAYNIHCVNCREITFSGGYCGGATANQAVLVEGSSNSAQGIVFTGGMQFAGNGDSGSTGDIFITGTPHCIVNGCIFWRYGNRSLYAVRLYGAGGGHNIIVGNSFNAVGFTDYPYGVVLDPTYTGTGDIIRDNPGYPVSGDTITIRKVIDHASLTDNGDATAYMDFDDEIPAGSIVKAVNCDFTEAFNSDDTTTLTMMIGYVGDLDAFNLTADPGENAFNHTTDVYWGESDCQSHIVTTAQTPRVTFTEDDDGTDIISSANAQGGVTISITYMKA